MLIAGISTGVQAKVTEQEELAYHVQDKMPEYTAAAGVAKIKNRA